MTDRQQQHHQRHGDEGLSRPVVALAMLRTAIPLLVMWLLLWQRIDPAVVLSGTVIAFGVTWLTRLPHLAGTARLRPVPALRAVGAFATDLFASSFTVARWALWHPQRVKCAVVGVPFLARSETVLALTAVDLTLRPGSLVLDVDRNAAILYVHGMPMRDEADLNRLRDEVTATERRLVEAFGSVEDVHAIRRGTESEGER